MKITNVLEKFLYFSNSFRPFKFSVENPRLTSLDIKLQIITDAVSLKNFYSKKLHNTTELLKNIRMIVNILFVKFHQKEFLESTLHETIGENHDFKHYWLSRNMLVKAYYILSKQKYYENTILSDALVSKKINKLEVQLQMYNEIVELFDYIISEKQFKNDPTNFLILWSGRLIEPTPAQMIVLKHLNNGHFLNIPLDAPISA